MGTSVGFHEEAGQQETCTRGFGWHLLGGQKRDWGLSSVVELLPGSVLSWGGRGEGIYSDKSKFMDYIYILLIHTVLVSVVPI